MKITHMFDKLEIVVEQRDRKSPLEKLIIRMLIIVDGKDFATFQMTFTPEDGPLEERIMNKVGDLIKNKNLIKSLKEFVE